MSEVQTMTPIEPRRPSRRRRLLKWTSIAVATLIVLGLLGWFTFSYITARQLEAEIAAIRDAGEPLTWWELAGLKASPSNAHSRNGVSHEGAGRQYAAALALTPDRNVTWTHDAYMWLNAAKKAGTNLTQEQCAEISRQLEPYRQALDLVHTASEIDECRFMLRPELMSHALETMSSARHVVDVLVYDIAVAVAEGRHDDAFRSLVSMLRLGRIFDTQPTVISHMVQRAFEALATESLEFMLERGSISGPHLIQLSALFESMDRPDRLRAGMLGERVYMLNAMYHVPEMLDPEATVSGEYITWVRMPAAVRRAMLVNLLRMYAELIDAADKPWPAQLEAMRGVAARGTLAELLQPSHDVVAMVAGRVLATTRVARTALAIEQYRAAEGDWPHELAQLTPRFIEAVPEDPFTGQPLQYHVTSGGGYKLYSIGEDGVDDRGVFEDAPRTGAPPTGPPTRDWGFEIRRGERKPPADQ